MLCRAVLTVAAVSYLICVLVLSGLQKEDLDVNMLQKLQRHGLDINDINNENLREECIKGASTTEKVETTKSEIPITISTMEISPYTEINQQQNILNTSTSNKTIIESFLKYFLDLQQSHNKTKQKNVEGRAESTIFQNYNIPQSSNLKYIFSETLGYHSPTLKKLEIQPTTEGVFHLFSQNILQLWNTYKKQDTKVITTSEPTTFQTTTPKLIEKSTNNYDQDMQYVKKLFADYITKNPISTTTPLPSTKDIDVDRISDIIRRFIANANIDSQNNKINKTSQLMENSIKIQTNDGHVDEKRYNFATYTEPNVINVTLPYQTENLQNLSIYGALSGNSKLFNNDNHINTVNNLYSNMQKDNNQNSESKISLPRDLIKELAESVKELVLRDIKKEISTIIPITNLPTTEISSTNNPKLGNGKPSEPNVVMEKIMELFQQIKSIKEKTIITENSKIKVTEKKDIHHEYKGPAKVIYSYKPVISPYGIKSPTEQIAPIFVKQYDREPNVNAPIHNQAVVQNPVYQVRQIDNYNAKDGLRLAPITIQTNSFEVAPLNIPIMKPLGMVNQNIIVTTESPNRRPRLDTHHTNYIRHIDRNKAENDFRSRNGWHKSSPSSERLYNSHRYDYDAPKVNHNNGYKRDYYKPHFTKSDYNRMRLRNQEMKRFHERLEKYDEPRSEEDREDCCKLKVASRQQLPLSEAKKHSRFDDIHFRNFLKTQQKVNDMLEKILATKTKSDGPRSVETT